MTKWIAFIVVTTYAPHPMMEWPSEPKEQEQWPSIDVDVNNVPSSEGHINVHMDRTSRVHKMIGVAADTTVNVPTTAMIEFPSEHLCRQACEVLGKQTGVLSASAIEVQS